MKFNREYRIVKEGFCPCKECRVSGRGGWKRRGKVIDRG